MKKIIRNQSGTIVINVVVCVTSFCVGIAIDYFSHERLTIFGQSRMILVIIGLMITIFLGVSASLLQFLQPDWIPCEIRYPDESGLYDITLYDMFEKLKSDSAYFDVASERWYYDYDKTKEIEGKIISWQSKRAPYMR